MLRIVLTGIFALAVPIGIGPASDGPAQTPKDVVGLHIEKGSDAKGDAAKAVRSGQFGLIDAGSIFGSGSPPGVQCRTPYKKAPAVLASFMHGDVIDEGVMKVTQYATTYNQAVVADPSYPDSDLCGSSSSTTPTADWDVFAIDVPATPPTRQPRTLYEAARWGTAADVRHFVKDSPINAADSLGMTALGWAVARNNQPAVDVLISEGADPWLGKPEGYSAVFWAAVFGKSALFARLSAMPGRSFEGWSARYLSGAVRGGDRSILSFMLAQPHERARSILFLGPLPSPDIMTLLLKDDPALANDLLWKAVAYSKERPDLVELALRSGADPNRQGMAGRYGTVLGEVAKGIGKASPEIVDLLLKAGADPNLISHRDRPIWIAVGMLKLSPRASEVDQRALAIFKRLRKAGADLNLPNDEGLPSVWGLLFPYRYDRGTLDASFITPPLLEMLVANGLDLNAEWKGQRVLPLVEKQAGPISDLAVTLKKLGARS